VTGTLSAVRRNASRRSRYVRLATPKLGTLLARRWSLVGRGRARRRLSASCSSKARRASRTSAPSVLGEASEPAGDVYR
jgi:hypothetical protein